MRLQCYVMLPLAGKALFVVASERKVLIHFSAGNRSIAGRTGLVTDWTEKAKAVVEKWRRVSGSDLATN